MPPPMDHPSLHLTVLPAPFYVYKVSPSEDIATRWMKLLTDSNEAKRFFSITRTDEEVSIVGEASEDVSDIEATWRCIKIAGPMEFELTGILASFVTPLKEAKVPIFAMSTWNTDYILLPKDKLDEGVNALKHDGWTFV